MKEPWEYLSAARNEFADKLDDPGRFDGREKDIVFRAIALAIADARPDELQNLIFEVLGDTRDWTDPAYALELSSRLAESGWFKRARAALTS